MTWTSIWTRSAVRNRIAADGGVRQFLWFHWNFLSD
jgi:hypothetical protein